MPIGTEKFKKLYFSEAEDKLSALNSALLGLEKDPTKTAFAEEAMRAAHTLKSSSAAMGYVQISSLAHAMEDFFEEVRSQKKELPSSVVQLLFESIDAINIAIELVKKGEEEPSAVQLVRSLQLNKNTTLSEDDTKKKALKSDNSNTSVDSRVFEPVTSIKVDTKLLDSLMTLTEELLVEKMRLEQVVKTMQDSQNTPVDLEAVSKNISRLMTDLQYTVTQTHMVPLGQIFERFPRVVRDLAKGQGKEVNFDMSGQDIELDRVVIDRLGEPLIHLLRNAVDHGVSDKGNIILKAERERDQVLITVENDGNSMDWHNVVDVAQRRGIIDKNTGIKYSKNINAWKPELEKLLYLGRLSTSEKVTEVSGRGVGLAIVKSTVESFGGRVTIETREGHTKFTLSIPLTIAIVQALLIRVSGNVFALPFAQVDRLVRVPLQDIRTMLDREVAVLGSEEVPILRLDELFGLKQKTSGIFLNKNETDSFRFVSKTELIVVTKGGAHNQSASDQIGLIVDEVFSEQDIVVKPMNGILKGTRGFAGTTLLGNGQPALIIDTTTLI